MKHLTLLCLLACALISPVHADPKLWETIKTQPNVVLVGRHMDVERGRGTHYDASGNCQGEVMLTPKGRKQAAAFGDAFKTNGVGPDKLHVVASAMCRMRDTAKLAFGKATLDSALRESFSGGGGRMNEFMDAAEGWIKKHRGTTPLLLLTHHPNIDALTSEQPDYGQVVVTLSDDSGGLNVLGMLRLLNPADF
jgi:hypothetical protein